MCPTTVPGGFGVAVTLLWEGRVSKVMAPIPMPPSKMMMQATKARYSPLLRDFFGDDNRLGGWSGVKSGSTLKPAVFIRLAGTGTLSAWASAIVMAEAEGKRSAGSLAMLRSTTADKAGGIFGLRTIGGVGIS